MAIFADTQYWIASIDSNDQWYDQALSLAEELAGETLVTTDEVLVELLNAFSGKGAFLRQLACEFVYCLRRDPNVNVIPQSRQSFDLGLIVYSARNDKGYSIVDCISMNTMHELSVTKILTHDHHFAQEGFEVLID